MVLVNFLGSVQQLFNWACWDRYRLILCSFNVNPYKFYEDWLCLVNLNRDLELMNGVVEAERFLIRIENSRPKRNGQRFWLSNLLKKRVPFG